MNLLLDTNVWLDYAFPERKNHAPALQLIGEAITYDAALFYAATSAKDVFFLAGTTLKRRLRAERPQNEPNGAAVQELAWGIVRNMRDVAAPVGIDDADLWLAERYRNLHGDFEDNLIIAAAQRCQADVLVTEDIKLIAHAPVTALRIEDARKLLSCTAA